MHAGNSGNASDKRSILVSRERGEQPNPASSLPLPLTSFVGREPEVQAILSLLNQERTRILTLTGPGGVGKTRLAVRAAREVESSATMRVTFVELASVSSSTLVAQTIGQAFGLSDADERSLAGRLAFSLGDIPHLLVLDNFEHVIDAATVTPALVSGCPSLTILTTSRVPLRVSGEMAYPVPPLTLLDPDENIDRWEDVPAVQLFLDRAGLKGDSLGDGERAAVAGICRKLDGLPLAIELAAAKTRLLTLPDLLSRMDRALPLLLDGPRDAPARLQTMRNAIAWSFALLPGSEQAFFYSLSVFSGGFTISSAEAIAAPKPDFDSLQALQSLLDHSLVKRIDTPEGPPRFTMLETIREFGHERLIASGHERRTRDNHAAWFAGLRESPDTGDWIIATSHYFQFPGEQDNFRAALRWSLAQGEAANAASLSLSLSPFWWRNGFFTESREALARVLAMSKPLPPAVHAALTGTAADFAFFQSDFESSGVLAIEALQIARDLGDVDAIRRHLRQVGWVAMVLDPPSAVQPIEEVVALSYELGDRKGTVRSLFMLAMCKVYIDQLPRAVAHVTEAQAIIDSLAEGDSTLDGESKQMWGSLALYAGEYDKAEPLLTQALTFRREQGNKVYELHCLRDLGRVALERGDRPTAASCYAAALELAYLIGSEHCKCYCFVEIAAVSSDPEASATLLGAAAGLRNRLSLSSMPTERSLRDVTTRSIRQLLGDRRFETACGAGKLKSSMELYAIAKQAASDELRHAPAPDTLLTPREREVLVLVTEGKSDREIGDALFVSRRTAATHVRNVLAKLDVHSRAEAAAWAVRNGIA